MNFTFEWHYNRPGKEGIAGAVLAETQTRATEIVKEYLFNHFHVIITESSNEALYVWPSRDEWMWKSFDPNWPIIAY